MKIGFRILVVDDDPTVQKVLTSRLERKGHIIHVASSGEEALLVYPQFKPDVLLCDLRMPGMNGFQVLSKISVPAILITGHGDKESAIKAVESGAFAFFEKPFDLDAIEVSVQRAGERRALLLERELLLKRLNRLCKAQDRELESYRSELKSQMVGTSTSIQAIRNTLKQLAKKPSATLLILGESGSGKEVLAKELHQLSFENPTQIPFLALNCATLPQELFESELFGHEKGSFSGALQARMGLAEAVREGTLFLDEIGEMDIRHQAKLLRFLQERSFRRVGSNHELSFRGRIVAATHRNLKEMVKSGQFREDLFFRLNVVTVEVPPLRQRSEDIPLLVEKICEKFHLSGVKDLKPWLEYNWPGNVRELHNWIERAAILDLFDEAQLIISPPPGASNLQNVSSFLTDQIKDLHQLRERVLEHYDRLWIESALDKHGGNVSQAAKELGIDRKNLSRRIEELGIKSSKKAA